MSLNSRLFKTVVVTGCTGAIGAAFVKLLVSRGIDVIAVAQPGSTRIDRLPKTKQVAVVQCDCSSYRELPGLVSACSESTPDLFVHLAWAKTTGAGRNDVFCQAGNIIYSLEAVKAACRMGCKAFLGVGSQAEYGPSLDVLGPSTPVAPMNAYGASKLCAGTLTRILCDQLGIDWMWARVLSVYGPGDSESSMIMTTIRALLEGQEPMLTEGLQKWDFLYSDDAARALLGIAEHGEAGKTYLVGSGVSRELREFAVAIRDEVDPDLPLGFGKVKCDNPLSLACDISELRADIGFKPQTSFSEGIRETVEWCRRNSR